MKEFVQKQIEVTDSVLKSCECRPKLGERINKVFDHPRYGAPFKRAQNYFYFHNTGLQPQSVLYVHQNGLEGEAEVLLDPNLLSQDGTVSLNTFSLTKDGKYLAYGLSSSGSDWVTIKVMRVEDKVVQPHTLSWVSNNIISRSLIITYYIQITLFCFYFIHSFRLSFALLVGHMIAKASFTPAIHLPHPSMFHSLPSPSCDQ